MLGDDLKRSFTEGVGMSVALFVFGGILVGALLAVFVLWCLGRL